MTNTLNLHLPSTAGSLGDVSPRVDWPAATAAIRTQFAQLADLVPGSISVETLDLARRLAPEHTPTLVGTETY